VTNFGGNKFKFARGASHSEVGHVSVALFLFRNCYFVYILFFHSAMLSGLLNILYSLSLKCCSKFSLNFKVEINCVDMAISVFSFSVHQHIKDCSLPVL
jgi:hypothetical protein